MRSVGPSPNHLDMQRYEIFHDALAQAILDWCGIYQQKQKYKKYRERVFAASSVFIFGFLFISFFTYAVYQRTIAEMNKMEGYAVTSKALSAHNAHFDSLIAGLMAVRRSERINDRPDFKYLKVLYRIQETELRQNLNAVEKVLAVGLRNIIERNRLDGHIDEVVDVDFSPDLEIVATASLDDTVKVWSLDGK